MDGRRNDSDVAARVHPFERFDQPKVLLRRVRSRLGTRHPTMYAKRYTILMSAQSFCPCQSMNGGK
jgi:hypothetical protein